MLCSQLWFFLISGTAISNKDFTTSLADLVKTNRIRVKDGWYYTGKLGRGVADQKRQHAAKLMARAQQVANHLQHIPWIEMVAVTGSVAAFNADGQSDIDLFIVTSPKRLFLTRLFLVVVLKSLGVYWNAKHPAGTICPNILVTSDNLSWDSAKRNLYVANEIALLYPLLSRHNCYFNFLKHNTWVTKFLPNFKFHAESGTSVSSTKNKPGSRPNLVDLLELAAMRLELTYMHNKQTTEQVTRNFIHFNTHDSAISILGKFEAR
jgi:predicted nucleotidyltransferase